MDFLSPTPDPIIAYLADKWKVWLSPAAIEVFLKNGCYSEPFRTADGREHANVKVVAVNSEGGYNSNFYLMG